MIWQKAPNNWHKLFLFLFCLMIFKIDTFAQTATLEVEIKGIEKKEGKIWVALYRTSETFLTKNLYQGIQKEVSVGVMKVVFENIEAGEYAISCFHDENNNGQLDTNMFGIPVEPYGFSNNPRLLFSAPKFDQAKIIHKLGGSKIAITLR